MDTKFIIGQAFGIVGLILMALSYQSKSNKNLFVFQALSGLSFAINFLLIDALSAGLFNIMNLVRGIIFARRKKKVWELVFVEAIYTACFVFSLTQIWRNSLDVFMSVLTFSSLVIMSVVMWRANPKHIRYTQLFYVSPVWLTNNIFYFTLGGIICEIFAMTSVIVSFIRYRKDGFDNN